MICPNLRSPIRADFAGDLMRTTLVVDAAEIDGFPFEGAYIRGLTSSIKTRYQDWLKRENPNLNVDHIKYHGENLALHMAKMAVEGEDDREGEDEVENKAMGEDDAEHRT
ncbi:hypothetical protein O6P43_026026 [Quillaja saponaria]|uniref:Uncharacterized protein n=1 Tax=Quillaja saponaria TaxID=32244 RepID=A0AAD7LBW2_QUISA|nr:hypothetical protein O6P43_026026 [Quillaja saponaria]